MSILETIDFELITKQIGDLTKMGEGLKPVGNWIHVSPLFNLISHHLGHKFKDSDVYETIDILREVGVSFDPFKTEGFSTGQTIVDASVFKQFKRLQFKQQNQVKFFVRTHRTRISTKWNSLRPFNCMVIVSNEPA